MPIYEFECSACSERFERLQKLSDPDPTACPQCGKSSVHRRISAPAFRLAGTGWYETDFKKEGDIKRNLADGGSAASSESKPAAADATGKAEPVAKVEPAKPAASTTSAAGNG